MARGVGEGAIIRERRLFYKVPSKGRGEAIFRGRRLIEGRLLFGKWPFFCLKLPNLYCVVPKISIPPPPPLPRRALFSTPPEGVWHTPSPNPWNFRNFPTWLGTPWKDISVKNAVAKYFIRKIIVSAIKREKIFFLMLIQCQMISILPCRGLS